MYDILEIEQPFKLFCLSHRDETDRPAAHISCTNIYMDRITCKYHRSVVEMICRTALLHGRNNTVKFQLREKRPTGRM